MITQSEIDSLRAKAKAVHHPFKWYATPDLQRGHAMEREDAAHIAALDPQTILDLLTLAEQALSPIGDGDATERALRAILDDYGPDQDLPPVAHPLAVRVLRALHQARSELADRSVGLTVGGGLSVFGTMAAISRAQELMLIDSTHPQEAEDVRRALLRRLTKAESELEAARQERDEARGLEVYRTSSRILEEACHGWQKRFNAVSADLEAATGLLREHGTMREPLEAFDWIGRRDRFLSRQKGKTA